jgi:hypothetical protein
MHHNHQAQFLGTQSPFGSNFGTGNYGFSNLGFTGVNPLTGQYIVQLVPTNSALNNNIENAFGQAGIWGGMPTHHAINGWSTPWGTWSTPWSNWGTPWGGHNTGWTPGWGQTQAWGTPWNHTSWNNTPWNNTTWNNTTWNNPSTNWWQGTGSQWGNVCGIHGGTCASPATFVTPTGWQNVSAWNGTGQSVSLTGSGVRYIHNDSDTVIEIYIPGVKTENLEVLTIGGELRIRQAGSRTQGGLDTTEGYLSVALPVYCDGTQLQAQAAGEYLRITVPTRKEVASSIKKFKPTRLK